MQNFLQVHFLEALSSKTEHIQKTSLNQETSTRSCGENILSSEKKRKKKEKKEEENSS